MSRETGKERSQRIEIDYFRKRTGLDRFRSMCIYSAISLTGAYVAFAIFAGKPSSQISTGPLARVHASFENDCRQCHTNFEPIDSDANQMNLSFVGIQSSESIAHLESACKKCHAVGDHYRTNMTNIAAMSDQNCSTCHHDHQGRDHLLNQVASAKCTSCHEGLDASCKAEPSIAKAISGFSEETHGDFKFINSRERGVIKFDHHQHMQPGQVDSGTRGAFTIAMLDASMRQRYQQPGQSDTDSVQLNCQSCHEMAGNPASSNSMIADGELGRYMKPVSFEKHCAACHSVNPGIATEQTMPIPHGQPWNKTELFLAATLVGAQSTGAIRDPNDDSQTTPQLGEGFGKKTPTNETIAIDVSTLAGLRKATEAQCLKCHDADSITDDAIRGAVDGTAPPMIPPRWLKHGLYDHAAHRQIDCRYCHQDAYPGSESKPSPPKDHEKMMIAGIESCVGCHRNEDEALSAAMLKSEQSGVFGGMPTWGSDDCTLCHRYHTDVTSLGAKR
ncbi:Doubled CXXCH motif protein [Rubripirellula obstinata]|uniref:Doubled CXXCH motif protein n=1 Tax=Rubripirellula obstinata TaxID=406547 RepID=A0A5B1CKK5_9BACT|nr:hypothetical protein [Rubripirellula obstinata]KAA1261737.1 Doubled CXXCH motif protein [Rubripirellula obstinata]